MNKVTYKRVYIEGFQSFGLPSSFDLDRGVGVNIVQGANGVGKSTIFNAIYWAEYGGNLKKGIESWDEIRTDKYRGTRVIVERTIGEYDYLIARHLNFSGNTKGLSGGDKLMIFKKHISKEKFESSDLVGKGLHKSDMQDLINKSLGMDEKAFLNSILFGQRVKSLVESKNEDKRKLFEELFDLQFIEAAKESAKEKVSEYNETLAAIEGRLDVVDDRILDLQTTLQEQQGILNNFDTDKANSIAKIEQELKEAQAELSDLQSDLASDKKKLAKFDVSKEQQYLSDLEDAESALDVNLADIKKSKARISEIDTSISKSSTNIQNYESELKSVKENCPTCSKPLDKTEVAKAKKAIKANLSTEVTVKSTLEKSKSDEEEKLKNLESETESLMQKKNDADKILKDFKDTNRNFYTLSAGVPLKEKSVASKEKEISGINTRLQEAKDLKAPKVDLKKTTDSIEELTQQKEADLKAKIEYESKKEKAQWWITKGFGASGLKAFVFNAMLNRLNMYAQKYASRLGFGVEFTVDMSKASKPFQTLVYKGNSIKDYSDLSGGQKQRVDICLAFAMHDLIINNKSNINILIVDELFEGLDSAGVEAAFELIRQKGEEKTVYVITHSTIIDGLNTRHITIGSDDLGNSLILT